MQDKLLNNNKITVLYNTEVIKLNGNTKLESIICKNNKSEDIFEMQIDGLFYGLGLTPNSSLFKKLVEVDTGGYIIRKQSKYETATSVPGIFVCGDVTDKVYRQAIVAAGDGCKAALDVNNFLTY